MKTILVDDEYWALESFKQECSGEADIQIAGKFMSSEEALAYAKKNPVDFALLDVEMPGMSGVALAKELRKLYPEVIIVFVTAYKEYLEDFLDMKADYFVLKPYTKKDVLDVLERAKLLSGRLKKRVYIRTFGEFEIFLDGKPLVFSSARAKELLALIVDRRGGMVSAQDAFSVLWEGKPYDNQNASAYRKVLHRLDITLRDFGIEDILIYSAHGRALSEKAVDCDLLEFFSGNKEARSMFYGKYMSQYSWSEETVGQLAKMAGTDRS